MKYRLEGTTIEAIDQYVRITMASGKSRVSAKQCPKAIEVSAMLEEMQEYPANRAQQQACGRACDDARAEKAAHDADLA